jgi:hypothetical protein
MASINTKVWPPIQPKSRKRFVVNYKKLNDKIKSVKYPSPRIDENIPPRRINTQITFIHSQENCKFKCKNTTNINRLCTDCYKNTSRTSAIINNLDVKMIPIDLLGLPSDTFCRNSLLKMDIIIPCINQQQLISEKLKITIHHIGGDTCTNGKSIPITFSKDIMSEIKQLTTEGLGLSFSNSCKESPCTHLPSDTYSPSSMTQHWDIEKIAIISKPPSLKNIASDAIVKSNDYRKYLHLQQKEPTAYLNNVLNNLLVITHTNGEHIFCLKWKHTIYSLTQTTHMYWNRDDITQNRNLC